MKITCNALVRKWKNKHSLPVQLWQRVFSTPFSTLSTNRPLHPLLSDKPTLKQNDKRTHLINAHKQETKAREKVRSSWPSPRVTAAPKPFSNRINVCTCFPSSTSISHLQSVKNPNKHSDIWWLQATSSKHLIGSIWTRAQFTITSARMTFHAHTRWQSCVNF